MSMAVQLLSSKLFRNDPALQACLVEDRSHILTGACGGQVAKIQLALSILDDANISLIELQARQYGASTAAAVLAYKTKRRIINYSYQKQADNIVGKMTIAALDREMLAWEQQPARNSYYCGDPEQGGGAAFQLVSSPAPAAAPKVVPCDLDILWQPSTGAGAKAHLALSYLVKAISLLKPFQIGIMSSVTAPPDAPFPFDPAFDADPDPPCWEARKAAEKVRPGAPNVLRILVCPLLLTSNGKINYAVTKSGPFGGTSFAPFIILNINDHRTDDCTLLHEMIHAANLKLTDKDHDPDKSSVFATGNARSVLKPEHAAELCKGFFARPRP
jgi:hypothetical protein